MDLKVFDNENKVSMDFTLNECVNLCLFSRQILLEKFQKVFKCVDNSLEKEEFSIETFEKFYIKRIEPLLIQIEDALKRTQKSKTLQTNSQNTESKDFMKAYFEMFEKDEKNDNYEYNREQKEAKKLQEIEAARKKKENIPFTLEDTKEIFIEKYYKNLNIYEEMEQSDRDKIREIVEIKRNENHNTGQISKIVDGIPLEVAIRFIMNYSRSVGRRYYPQEVKAVRTKHIVEYIQGRINKK